MSGYAISQRAFRFNVGSREFAIDIQSNVVFSIPSVCLYELQPGGSWFMKYVEFGPPEMAATDATINAAGGVVPFCRLIVERVNKALSVIFGDANVEPPKNLIEQVQDHLRVNLKLVYVDGIPRLQF